MYAYHLTPGVHRSYGCTNQLRYFQITCYGCLFDFHGYMYSVVVVMLSKDITTLYMYPINLFNSCPNSL